MWQDKLGTVLGQTHYKMISCNIWLPVVIHRSKTRNNALDVFWGIETIIMPLSRQPQKKSFCPVSHSLAPTFMKIFFIMRLPWVCPCLFAIHLRCVPICLSLYILQKKYSLVYQSTIVSGTDLADLVFVVKLRERCEVREAATATKRNVVKRSE